MKFHDYIDSEDILVSSAYLCPWSDVSGVARCTPTISKLMFDKPEIPDVFEECCIWITDWIISYRATDRPSFQNGFGLRIPQFGPRWNGQNVSKQIIMTGNKIKKYFKENCLTISKKMEPSLIIDINSPSAHISASPISDFRNIKDRGLVFSSMKSDYWLTKTNREYIGIKINFLCSGVRLHTIRISLFAMWVKSKEEHGEHLTNTAVKYGFSKLLSSITTDNCSAILGAADGFKYDIDFPSFRAHIGCLAIR